MRSYRAFASAAPVALVLLASACGPQTAPAPPDAAAAPEITATETGLWFICDAINLQSIFVLRRAVGDTRVLLTEYDKTTGAPALRAEYVQGAPEGVTGSLYTPLLREGVEIGQVRTTNAGMLENPGSAYTERVVSLRLGEREAECRWMPRTRLVGFDETRSYVVYEDADGDLIYTTFNFGDGGPTPIDLSENGRSTGFSLEVRNGQEAVGPLGSEFRFENDGYLYLVVAPLVGPATVEVWRGNQQFATETLIAYQVGEGPAG